MTLIKNKKIKIFFFIVASLIALSSLLKSFHDAQLISFDFHYTPTKLVAEGTNHYQYILDGKHDHGVDDRLKYAQNGNYAHGLFVLLIPLTWLDWENSKTAWALINILISFLLPILICKKFNLSKYETLFVLIFFLSSTIFRIHIGYGQQTLFTYFFFILPFIFKSNFTTILSGISYFKFNIGYALFLYFLSLRDIKKITLSLIPVIIGWLSYSYITDTILIKSLLDPFKVILYWNSDSDHFPVTIFSALKFINAPKIIIIIIPIIISFLVILRLRKIEDELLKMSLISLSALCFLPHQLHDYVLLLPLLIFSVKNYSHIISKINLLFIFYFFYFLRIISFFYGTQPWEFPYGYFGYFNNFLTILIICFNLYLNKTSNKIY